MNNGYNRGGRQIPRDSGQRPVQNSRQQRPSPDPRMIQNGRMPRQGGQMPRGTQPMRQGQPRPAADPRMNAGRQMPANGGRQMPAGGQPRPDRRQGHPQTRALNDTHRKATREQLRADNKRRRKESRRLFFGRLALYGVMLLIVAGIVGGVFACVFYRTPDDNESTVNFIEKYDGKTGVSTKVSEDLAYKNGMLYLNFSGIAGGCGMTVIEDAKTAKFVLPDGGETSDSAGTGHEEYVTFVNESTEIVVCGQDFRLPGAAVFSDNGVWIPAEFVMNYMNGITVSEDKAGGNVYITREKDSAESGDEDAPLAEVSFKLKAITAPDPTEPPEDAEQGEKMPDVTFSTDLSAYEKYMNPEDAKEFLVLANKTNALDEDYVPDDLVNIENTRDDGRATQKMRETAAKALNAMFIEMNAAGYTDVSVTSAYRSYDYQKELYDGYVASQGQEAADKISAKPGTSEHQTGLCADLHNLPSADEAFANEEAYTWLSENAWKFGFILRFPADKTEITGYDFEPWHYRFVGRNAAWQIYNKGICFEEYIGN